jgi:hypothetical protein
MWVHTRPQLYYDPVPAADILCINGQEEKTRDEDKIVYGLCEAHITC